MHFLVSEVPLYMPSRCFLFWDRTRICPKETAEKEPTSVNHEHGRANVLMVQARSQGTSPTEDATERVYSIISSCVFTQTYRPTGVPHLQENAPLKDPAVRLCLGPVGLCLRFLGGSWGGER